MKYISARATTNSDRESVDFISFNNCGAFIDVSKTILTSRPEGRMDYQIIFVSEGCLEITDKDKKITAEDGSIILFRPHEPQLYSAKVGSTFYWMHFSGKDADGMLSFFKERVYKTGTFPEFEEVCRECVTAFAAKKTNCELFCIGRLISLIALISQKISADNSNLRNLLKNALLDMHTNLALSRSNEEYAKLCGLSKSHFIRLFCKCMDMPPQKYRTALVMREAKHLLKNNSVNVTAYLLGFSDVFYFSRLFKKTVGYPPSKYIGSSAKN